MNLNRRDFIKTTLTASATVAALGCPLLASEAPASVASLPAGRDFYELRAYRLKTDTQRALLDGYLEKAFIPAVNRLGLAEVGVFTEPEAKDGLAVWVLIPHRSLESVAGVTAALNADPAVQSKATEYLSATTPSAPPFERLDSWLFLAFAGLPRLAVPALAREGKSRIYELRTYESFNELKALKKVDMFNAGEIGVMQELNMSPVFYGQALVGRDLPHLTYMVSSPDRATLAQSWSAFGKHPVWQKLKTDPQYADTVSKITSRMLVPAAYSQI